MLVHFTNNAISVSLGYLTGNVNTTTTITDYSGTLGVYLILGFTAPIIITLGLMLVHPEGHKKIRFLYAGIMAAVMLVSGFALSVVASSKNMIMNSTFSYKVTEESNDYPVVDFNVEDDCDATVVVILTNAEGDYRVQINGDKGSNIINADIPEGPVRMITYNVKLQADHYDVMVIAGDNAIDEQPNIQITIK